MDYIVEVLTRDGKICERFRSYARAKRRIEQIPDEQIIGIPCIFKILPDGSQRLVREDDKPLQWHRIAEDGSVVTDEAIPLSEEEPELSGEGPSIRPIPRDPGIDEPWSDERD